MNSKIFEAVLKESPRWHDKPDGEFLYSKFYSSLRLLDRNSNLVRVSFPNVLRLRPPGTAEEDKKIRPPAWTGCSHLPLKDLWYFRERMTRFVRQSYLVPLDSHSFDPHPRPVPAPMKVGHGDTVVLKDRSDTRNSGFLNKSVVYAINAREKAFPLSSLAATPRTQSEYEGCSDLFASAPVLGNWAHGLLTADPDRWMTTSTETWFNRFRSRYEESASPTNQVRGAIVSLFLTVLLIHMSRTYQLSYPDYREALGSWFRNVLAISGEIPLVGASLIPLSQRLRETATVMTFG